MRWNCFPNETKRNEAKHNTPNATDQKQDKMKQKYSIGKNGIF